MTRDEALQASIDHWRRMLDLTVENIKAGKEAPREENCALCDKYRAYRDFEDQCMGCPVFERTGMTGCEDTPYEWAAYVYRIITPKMGKASIKRFRAAVQDEIDFLESLQGK